MEPGDRTDHIVSTLASAFGPLIAADPHAFRTKFRKMARDPFAFYRGSASLFYADVGPDGDLASVDERWASDAGSRVWIQGDLHAANFGTHMDAGGRLVFDVNDFDEAYIGPWTWDVRRFVASLALLCWQKALPDEAIDDLVGTYVRAYVEHVRHYLAVADDTEWALTLDNAEGAVLAALRRAKVQTRYSLLESVTVVESFGRRFADRPGVRRLDDAEHDLVTEAFDAYTDTIPRSKQSLVIFDVLDLVGKAGFGIGSAGLPAYNVLIEGFNQALDNDVVLTIKQGNVAAPSRVVADERVAGYFHHHGHRTVLSQRALQAHSDRFLGWTSLDEGGDGGGDGDGLVSGGGYVVSEFSPYEQDLDWDEVTEPDEMAVLVRQLGQATAKIHCVADDESDHDLVGASVEQVVAESIGDDIEDLVTDMVSFAHDYAQRTRDDHGLFVDAFRSGAFHDVLPT